MGHVVGSRPMKRNEKIHGMIIQFIRLHFLFSFPFSLPFLFCFVYLLKQVSIQLLGTARGQATTPGTTFPTLKN